MLPKVSIIIPTYNRSKYVVQAIESALAQDYPNLEIVVSDNCSTDETQKVVKKFFNDIRFKYFRNEKNLGMVGNWKKALYEYITGEWAIVLSDDDYFIDSQYISKAIDLINENKNIVIVHANQIIYDINANTKKTINRKFPMIMEGKEVFINYQINDLVFFFATTIFNVNLMKKNDSFNHNILSSDWLEFLRLSLYGNVGFINDFVVVYRRHSNSEMTKANIDMLFENVKYIFLPYLEAKNKKIFSYKILEDWRRRLLKNYFNSVLNRVLLENNINILYEFFIKIKKEYPESLPIFYYPKNIFKLLLFKFPFVFRKAKIIREFLRERNNK